MSVQSLTISGEHHTEIYKDLPDSYWYHNIIKHISYHMRYEHLSLLCDNMHSDLPNHAAKIFNEVASPNGHFTQDAKCQGEMLREGKCSQHPASINTRQNACWDVNAIN